MGCASIKWSVLRAYATLRNFVSQISHSENACLRRPLVLLRQDLLPLKTWGGLPVALGDGKSPLPPSLYRNLRAESILALRSPSQEAHH